MKKIFTTLFAGLMISAQVMAVSIMDVCGKYDGTLLLDSEEYPGSEVYLLPGVTDNTLTFVLPDFKYNGVSLGSIVLPNITMSEDGQFSIEETTLYLQGLLNLRATINILASYEEGGKTYTSQATESEAGIVRACRLALVRFGYRSLLRLCKRKHRTVCTVRRSTSWF